MKGDKTCLTDGSPVTPDHKELKANGQQKGYMVICPEDRAKGFIRPYRNAYVHVGPQPKYPLRGLTEEEEQRYGDYYAAFEEYPDDGSAKVGRFWTQREIDNNGCKTITTMDRSIAETYAREPKFYGKTFCSHCGVHLPVEEFVWHGTDELVGS